MAVSKLRFAKFIRLACVHQNIISYNNVVSSHLFSSFKGKRQRVRLRSVDIYRLLQPYISVRFMDQCKAVIPLVVYLLLFQVLLLRQNISEPVLLLSGMLAVILGLMLFMEGLKQGLMPFGERIGTALPRKASLPVVLIIALLLGIGVTFAEPAIGALKTAGAIVDVQTAPYLYTMLNEWSGVLVLVVGIGVGLATVLGSLRLLYGWSLKPLIYLTLTPALGLSVFFMQDAQLSTLLGLAWDCGAVTTGPVTVPLVLALGIGMAAAAGKANSPLAGFGIVTLASLFPVIGVMLLTLFVATTQSPESIIAAVQAQQALGAAGSSEVAAWYMMTPGQEIVSGLRAIVPLVIFLMIVMKLILGEGLSRAGVIIYGLVLCVLGMIIFNLGLSYGLSKIGGMVGSMLPAAFAALDGVAATPLYTYVQGVAIALIFACLLGFGSTLAEPALNTLGQTVETLTQGSFKKEQLMYAVSVGVGVGIMLGVMKIIFGIPLAYLLLPSYILGLVLTYFSSEEFVNVAWDSAGVTTGPVTVPLVLAMGLGLGAAVDATEGFGILSMASIGPIISVLSTGLWIQFRANKASKKAIELEQQIFKAEKVNECS
ncbi:MAG: DUF1538 domain-containing protein [Mariprofundaceae bacterium]